MKPIILILTWAFLGHPVIAQEHYFLDETDLRLPQETSISTCADAADIDGDGDLDIIGTTWAAVPPYQPYYLFVNNGRGFFAQENEQRLPDTSFLSNDVGFADFDGDEDYDIYIQSEHNQDLIFINDGSGYFDDETTERLPLIDCNHGGFAIADFSSDSCWDIITICLSNYGDSLTYYMLNDCSGYFEDVTDERMPPDTVNFDVCAGAADLDNDLDVDLLLGWMEDSSILHIRGLENEGGYFFPFEEGRIDDLFTRWMDFADIDDDGDLDVIISGIIDLGILINYDGVLADETDDRIENLGPEYGNPAMIGLGDYDNDGDIDIYAGFAIVTMDHLFINDGHGYFERADERIPATEASTNWVEPFDADGDGDLDLFLACSGDGIQRILINYSSPDTIPPNFLAFEGPEGIVDTAEQYDVRISAYDNISVEKGSLAARLSYRVNGGTFEDIDFSHCGGTIFSTAIPSQPEGTHIEYYISLTDRMRNTATLPDDAPDSLHDFWVSYRTEADAGGSSGTYPEELSISVYPNPFNSSVTICQSGLPVGSEIAIYDILARLVTTLKTGKSPSRLVWDGRDQLGELAPSGIYFVRFGSLIKSKCEKVLLLR